MAAQFRVDPILVRLGFIALTFVTDGLGLLFYIALWVALPLDNGTGRRSLGVTIPALVFLAIAAFFGWVMWMAPERLATGIAMSALLVALWVFGTRRHTSSVPVGLPDAAWQSTHAPPSLHHASRRHTPYVWTAVGVLSAWVIAWVLTLAGIHLTAVVWPASALLIVGIVLVAASRTSDHHTGRPRGLIVTGAVLSVITLLATPYTEQFGSATPASTKAISADARNQYDLQGGYQDVDLSNISVSQNRTITIAQETGRLRIRIPDHVRTHVQSSVAVGEIKSAGESRSGMDNALTQVFNDDAGDPTLTVIVTLDAGRLEVVR